MSRQRPAQYLDRMEQTWTPQPGADCEHLNAIRDVDPGDIEGCEDCLREGSSWVHLRLCLECGHVGCCDSSPRKHARTHWQHDSHPIMRSAEPGEDWARCFDDEVLLGANSR